MAYLLDWTGFPLADVGIAALCAMTSKRAPFELTLEDLDRAASEMRRASALRLPTSASQHPYSVREREVGS